MRYITLHDAKQFDLIGKKLNETVLNIFPFQFVATVSLEQLRSIFNPLRHATGKTYFWSEFIEPPSLVPPERTPFVNIVKNI